MSAMSKFRTNVDKQVSKRIGDESAGKGSDDIFRLLLNHKDKTTGEKMGFKELSDEAVVLIIAGESFVHFFMGARPMHVVYCLHTSPDASTPSYCSVSIYFPILLEDVPDERL